MLKMKIEVDYSTDNNYSRYIWISILSLLKKI